MTNDKAHEIYAYLVKNNMGFCFLQSTGQLVTREDCEAVILANIPF